MRRMIGISIIISGAIFSIFVLNLLLYSFVPDYRTILLSAVPEDDNIPVVEASGEITILPDEETALSPAINLDFEEKNEAEEKIFSEKKPEIVERTYHEDCGTGRGYWVIRYSDGTVGIE